MSLTQKTKWLSHGGNQSALINEDYLLGLEKEKNHLQLQFLKKGGGGGSELSSTEAMLGLIEGSLLEVASLALHVKTF